LRLEHEFDLVFGIQAAGGPPFAENMTEGGAWSTPKPFSTVYDTTEVVPFPITYPMATLTAEVVNFPNSFAAQRWCLSPS
jgi:hypothetical protein